MAKVYTNFPFRLPMTTKMAIKEIVGRDKKYHSITDFINRAIQALIYKEGGKEPEIKDE